LRLGVIPGVGPLPTTRRLPAVIGHGMKARGKLPRNQHRRIAGDCHVGLPGVVAAAPDDDEAGVLLAAARVDPDVPALRGVVVYRRGRGRARRRGDRC
jgi:hypothetical protein